MRTMNRRRKVQSHLEIEEYANYLGLDLEEDQDLLYIAREGLKAPLPPPWKPCQSKGKDIFYFNFETQESVWEHPCDKYYKEKVRELKAAKSKRRSIEQKPMRTPPSTGKTASKPIEISSKSSKAEKPSAEMESFRQELEGEKAMVMERNESQLAEYRKDLQNQLVAEEQRLKQNYESEKEGKMEEKRRELMVMQVQEQQKVMTGKTQRLENLKAELKAEVEREKRRLEDENSRSLSRFLESESRLSQVDLRSQSSSLDQRLSQLHSDLQQAQSTYQHLSTSLPALNTEELTRIHTSKDTVLHLEIDKERKRFENELISIQNNLQIRLSTINKSNLQVKSSFEDFYEMENRLKEECNREFQEKILLFQAKMQEKLLKYRQELENRYEIERKSIQNRENRGIYMNLEEEKRKISDEAAKSLFEYSKRLENEMEEEKRRMEDQWNRKLEELRLENRGKSQGNEEKRLEDELFLLKNRLKQKEREIEITKRDFETALNQRQSLDIRPKTSETHVRIDRLEREISDLKRFAGEFPSIPAEKTPLKTPVIDPIHEWRGSLSRMKQEIKEFQHVLEQEKRIWLADCANYRDHPSLERKEQLQAVKKVLDEQIGKLNEKVRELKLVEGWIKRREEGEGGVSQMEELEEVRTPGDAFEPDEDVLTRWRYGLQHDPLPHYPVPVPIQPYMNQKLHIYQRYLTSNALERERFQTFFLRHNAWISNMKEELNKAQFGARPRTSYYY